MRVFSILVTALFLTVSVNAQDAFNKFYNANKDKSAFKMNLSASFASSFFNDDDKDDLDKLIKNSGDFSLMVFENDKNAVSSSFKKFRRKNDLKTLVRVKDKGSRAEIFFIEKGDYIREIIVQASSNEDKLVLLGLETKITRDELASIMEDVDKKKS